MRKIFRIFALVMMLNMFFIVIQVSKISYSIFSPSFKDAGITFQEIITQDVPESKLELLNHNIAAYSNKKGKEAAKKAIDALTILFPAARKHQTVSTTNIQNVTIEQVLKMQNQEAQAGVKSGLEILSNSVESNKSTKLQAISPQ